MREKIQLKKSTLFVLLFVAVGCVKNSDIKNDQGGSLLLMYAQTENAQDVANRIAADVLQSGVEKGRFLLCTRLDDVYNSSLRDELLVLLYKSWKFSPELRKSLLDYYTRKPPSQLSENFYDLLLCKDDYFLELLDIYIAFASQYKIKELLSWFEQKRSLSEAEFLRYVELVFMKGDLSRANLLLLNRTQWSTERHRLQAALLTAKIAFFQSRYQHCIQQLLSSFELQCQSPVIEFLVDAFLLLHETQKASKVLSIISSDCFETGAYHVLQAKLMLFAKNPYEALRHWEIARGLNSEGERFCILSFYLSHYFPDKIPLEAMGRFADWRAGKFNDLDLPSLSLHRERIYLVEYESLNRADERVKETLRHRIALAMLK